VAAEPLESVAVVELLGVREKSTPRPESATVWVRLGALSVRVSVPESGPAVVGLKTRRRLQAELLGRLVGQVFEARLKLGGMAMLVTVSGKPPLLVRVTD